DGAMAYTPRSEEELSKLQALVRSAIGYNEARGDQVEVVNLQFAPIEEADFGAVETPAEENGLNLGSLDLTRIAELAVIGVLLLSGLFFVIRPFLGRIAPGFAGGAAAGTALPGATPALAIGSPERQDAIAGALPPPDTLNEDVLIDIAQVAGKVKQSSVRKIGELVTNHPD